MERGSAEVFSTWGTIGIEEEFYVVDADGRPTAGTDELVYECEPPEILQERLDHELFKCIIETQIPTAADLTEAQTGLQAVRDALIEHATTQGYRVAAAGLHPAARWRELEHAEKPRYRSQLERIQYPQHRNTTAGLHVHIGVDDPDKAVWVANELRWYLPPLLALSANSPYWNGFDTGLQSARGKIFEGLPNTGMPTTFEGFADYQAFERRMIDTGAIDDRGELWYDVRPHTAHGTVEVRTPDAQADPKRTMAIVEYVRALVLDLAARYEDGESTTPYRRELLDENKWRAIRYGRDASFLTREQTEPMSLDTIVTQECDRLGVDGLRRLYNMESGATRQRRLRDAKGLDELCQSLLL